MFSFQLILYYHWFHTFLGIYAKESVWYPAGSWPVLVSAWWIEICSPLASLTRRDGAPRTNQAGQQAQLDVYDITLLILSPRIPALGYNVRSELISIYKQSRCLSGKSPWATEGKPTSICSGQLCVCLTQMGKPSIPVLKIIFSMSNGHK